MGFFLVVLGFELRALHLLVRSSTASSPLKVVFIEWLSRTLLLKSHIASLLLHSVCPSESEGKLCINVGGRQSLPLANTMAKHLWPSLTHYSTLEPQTVYLLSTSLICSPSPKTLPSLIHQSSRLEVQ
jgi:hypothetical protein